MDTVQQVLTKIREIGPVLPGTLEKHFNVCGKPGCRCKDKNNPQRHGPYFRLSYSLSGKNSSIFVKTEDAPLVEEMTGNYRKLRALTMELALATLQSVKQSGVGSALQQGADVYASGATVHAWREKCRTKTDAFRAAQVKINDLTASRGKWKQECANLREEKHKLQQQLAVSEERVRTLEQDAVKGKKS